MSCAMFTEPSQPTGSLDTFEYGDSRFFQSDTPYVLAIRVVEFSSGGGTNLERFLPKNQHTQRKLLNFENWTNGKVSKSAKI